MAATVEAGSVAGFSGEETPALVLPGFGSSYRLKDGVLVVAPAG